MRVLFVCSGNTCRSPMAEVLLRRMLEEAGREDITVTSAGSAAIDGAPASEGAYLIALEQGLDLSSHRARLLTPNLIEGADLILTMSRGHLARVARLGGAERAHLLGEYAGLTGAGSEVRDPFGSDVETYRATFMQLRVMLAAARDRLLSEQSS